MIYRFLDYELDAARHELRHEGQSLPLQPRVLALLFHLVQHRDRAVSKSELLDEVWSGAIVVEAALTRAASVLRSTLGDTDRTRRIIVTVPGVGYRFAADVAEVSEVESEVTPAPLSTSFTRAQARRDLIERPAVAVLPFAHGERDEDRYFADGVTDELTTALSYWKRFPVIGRRTAATMAKSSLGLTEIASQLEARYVLEGSIRRAGDRVRISASLSDARQGQEIWAARYERPIGDLFQVQDDICEQIVRGIEPELTRAEIDRALRKHPEHLDAWDLGLQAAALMHEGTRDSVAEAGRVLERALAVDPRCPHVHSLIALHRFEEALFGWADDPVRVLARAQQAARDACRYDPRDWFAQAVLGITTLWVDGDHARAIDLVEGAIELNPSGARSYQFLGCVLEFAGRLAEATEVLQIALRLDPLLQSRALVLADLGLCHMLLGEYEHARQLFAESLDFDPQNTRAMQRLVATAGHLGDVELAREIHERLLAVQPKISVAYLDATYPFVRSSDREHFMEGFEKAGVRLG